MAVNMLTMAVNIHVNDDSQHVNHGRKHSGLDNNQQCLSGYKMADTNIEMLYILRHYSKLGHKATVAARKMREVEGHAKNSDRTAQNWYKCFKEGDLSLEIKPRSERPSVVILQDLKQKVEMNPTKRTGKLSEELGPSKDTICRALHKLQKTCKNSREVPYELTPQQTNQQVEICKTLLENPQDMRFSKPIVTCDKKWVHLRNPDN
ncbi:Histone-lysine N-methyltransferase SETMAR [Araneus ventricosus]|uniref:Histone-lysine N-methyltransferase SETMAR n=1 Tax=Araneus ventricosus TaxID=182803 RepID=A0A4Y2S000_ARAVE|nr:Histone-lysine N-methyltransferase SETMAR [Araneus ventricosus]